jgi:hypothetical protein
MRIQRLAIVSLLAASGTACHDGDSNGFGPDAAPDGSLPPTADYGSTDPIYDGLYNAAMSGRADAKWVATNGSDSADGTQAAPFATMAKALSSISGGGTIIVKDGTYQVGRDGWINDFRSTTIPSGTAAKYTLIRAENRFAVRLEQGAADYEGAMIRFANAKYVWADGFIVEKNNDISYPIDVGDSNRLTRTIVVQHDNDDYGGAVIVGDNSVIEDVHAYGWARYTFMGGTPGTSKPAGRTVLRRSISMLAGGRAKQPSASFAFYGSNDAEYGEVKDMLYANCYEIDSPAFALGRDARKWGSWYHPKSVRNVLHSGCGSINSSATYGAFRTDNITIDTAKMAQYQDSFVAGFTGDNGPAAAFSMAKGINSTTNASVCNTPGGAVDGVAESNTAIDPPYATVREGSNGADQRYAVGKFLSGFGEPGFMEPQTNMPLWPFPYESFVAREFGVSLPKPIDNLPTEVTATSNPFAGTSKTGLPMTFTRRVWEACGTETPSFKTIYP